MVLLDSFEVFMVIEPKVRGFICVTTHPTGCEANVKQLIDYVKSQPKVEMALRKS